MRNLEKIFSFLHQVENLKSTLRYNKTKSGRQESTAEHTWRLALMAFLIGEELKLDLDTERVIKIALVHDINEALTGDIDAIKIAEGKFSKADKAKLELAAMRKIKALLPSEIGYEIYALWQEYEQAQTLEAKYIKALDKLETLTQLVDAGYKTYDKPEFIANYADQAIQNFPRLLPLLQIIKQDLKKEFKKGEITWYKNYDALI